MGTDDRRTGTDRQAVFADLAGTVQAVRGGDHAREIAATVFRHATGSTTLVGLTGDCERVVVYESNASTLTAIPLDEHRLHRGDAERLWNRLADPTTWVDAHGGDLAWVHPRYRWVLDDDAAVWQSPPRP